MSLSDLGDVNRSGQWSQDIGNSGLQEGDVVQPTEEAEGAVGRNQPTSTKPSRLMTLQVKREVMRNDVGLLICKFVAVDNFPNLPEDWVSS